MFRTFTLFAFLGCASLATASTQTLTWEIETQEFQVGPGPSFDRPAGIEQFLSYQFDSQVCEVYFDASLSYDLLVTNLSTTPVTAFLGVNVSRAVVWAGQQTMSSCFLCWRSGGADGTQPLSIPSIDLQPGEVRQVSGIAPWPGPGPGWASVNRCAGFSTCPDDGLHGLGQVMHHPGPGTVPVWTNSSNDYSIQDLGSGAVGDLRIRTRYELPLVAQTNGCNPLQNNSTGVTGQLEAFGLAEVNNGLVVLEASSLPVGEMGYYLIGTQSALAGPLGNGQGTLCLGGQIHRWHATVATVPASGELFQEIPTSDLPFPTGITSGSQWHFQFWHRDSVVGGSGSNTTNAVSIAFL